MKPRYITKTGGMLPSPGAYRLPEQTGRKKHRTPFPSATPAGITHYTLQALCKPRTTKQAVCPLREHTACFPAGANGAQGVTTPAGLETPDKGGTFGNPGQQAVCCPLREHTACFPAGANGAQEAPHPVSVSHASRYNTLHFALQMCQRGHPLETPDNKTGGMLPSPGAYRLFSCRSKRGARSTAPRFRQPRQRYNTLHFALNQRGHPFETPTTKQAVCCPLREHTACFPAGANGAQEAPHPVSVSQQV